MLLKTIALFASDNNTQQVESFEEKYKLLLEIEDKDRILDFVKLSIQAEDRIKKLDNSLNELYKRESKDAEFFEKGDITTALKPEIIEEYFKLIDEKQELQVYFDYVSHYLATLEEANQNLVNGVPITTVKKDLNKKLKKLASTLTKAKVNLVVSKNMGKAIVDAKKRNRPNIQMKGVIEKIEKKIKSDSFFKSEKPKKKMA